MKIKKSTLKKILRFSAITLGFLFVGVFVYGYFGTPWFTITSVSFTGVEETSLDEVQSVTKKTLSGKRLFFFPNNKIFTYPTHTLTKNIKEVLPNTDTVSFHISGLHTLEATVTPYVPLLRLPDGEAIDARGIIYKEQHDITALPLLTFASGTVVTSRLLASLVELNQKINTIAFPITAIAIDEYGDITLRSDETQGSIRIRGDADFKKVWSTLVSALDTDPLKTMMKTDKSALEYIDVRFGNKVFYKFTNGTQVSIISSHNATTTTQTPTR
jgi:cell division septal protein FtsQ